MKITRTSMATGIEHTLDLPTVTQERLDQCWHFHPQRKGKHIQEGFPELSPDEREFLISGTTAQEWEELYGPEEDDDA
jgi:hypothetical protein